MGISFKAIGGVTVEEHIGFLSGSNSRWIDPIHKKCDKIVFQLNMAYRSSFQSFVKDCETCDIVSG